MNRIKTARHANPSALAVFLAGYIFFVGGTPAAPAQNAKFTVGSATGIPNAEIKLPVYLTLSAGEQFERVVATIDYPRTLAFSRSEAAKDGPAKGLSILVKETAPQTGAKTKRLEVTVKGEQGKTLPTGMLGSLFFGVDKKAIEQMMSIPVAEAKGFPKGSETTVALHGDAGSVVIYLSIPKQEPLAGCFFFSH